MRRYYKKYMESGLQFQVVSRSSGPYHRQLLLPRMLRRAKFPYFQKNVMLFQKSQVQFKEKKQTFASNMRIDQV